MELSKCLDVSFDKMKHWQGIWEKGEEVNNRENRNDNL
jgi:hypothetical protein